MARLAIDLVSGPAGIAAVLRQGLLDQPYNTPSLPLDIGYSDSIPAHIRRAVLLRDKRCAWPRCGRPAVYCDVQCATRRCCSDMDFRMEVRGRHCPAVAAAG
jgi:hypothetical protein